MPIYEYRCDACGHQAEFIQKISDPPHTLCPVCGKEELKRLISAAGFRLKGGGWYETDFKTGGKKNLHGDSAQGGGSSGGSSNDSSSKSESKATVSDKAPATNKTTTPVK